MKRMVIGVLLGCIAASSLAQAPTRGGFFGRMDKQNAGAPGGERHDGQFRREPGERRMTQDERREMRRELDQANEEIYKRRRER